MTLDDRDSAARTADASAPTASPRGTEDQVLLEELWRISHFGWVSEATVHRGLIISGLHETLGSGLTGRLSRLLEREWVEQRPSTVTAGESEWRLTASGRILARAGLSVTVGDLAPSSSS